MVISAFYHIASCQWCSMRKKSSFSARGDAATSMETGRWCQPYLSTGFEGRQAVPQGSRGFPHLMASVVLNVSKCWKPWPQASHTAHAALLVCQPLFPSKTRAPAGHCYWCHCKLGCQMRRVRGGDSQLAWTHMLKIGSLPWWSCSCHVVCWKQKRKKFQCID